MISKAGKESDCEDGVYFDKDFVAVVDGVTSKGGFIYEGRTTGYIAKYIVLNTISKLERDSTEKDAILAIHEALKAEYESHNNESVFSATAAIYSDFRDELWLIGDCQAILNTEEYTGKSKIDRITSEARALFIHEELKRGKTVEEFQEHDYGRDFIMPLLEKENCFENDTVSEYGYSVLNGIVIPKVQVIKNYCLSDELVLATDGYPYLMSTLEESESLLKRIITEDPLRINNFKGTKGLIKGCVSFDDRAYIRVKFEGGKESE